MNRKEAFALERKARMQALARAALDAARIGAVVKTTPVGYCYEQGGFVMPFCSMAELPAIARQAAVELDLAGNLARGRAYTRQ